MSKRLKPSCAAYLRLKVNREEILTKYAESIHAYVKKAKNRKVMVRKVSTSRKS